MISDGFVYHRTIDWKGPQCSSSSNPLLCAGSPTSSPGSPEPHPAWPWMPAGMGHPQPPWTTCSSASAPSECRCSCHSFSLWSVAKCRVESLKNSHYLYIHRCTSLQLMLAGCCSLCTLFSSSHWWPLPEVEEHTVLLAQILLFSESSNDLKPLVIASLHHMAGFHLVLFSISIFCELWVHLFFVTLSGSPEKHGKKKFLLKTPDWLTAGHAVVSFSLGSLCFSIVWAVCFLAQNVPNAAYGLKGLRATVAILFMKAHYAFSASNSLQGLCTVWCVLQAI